MNKEAWLKILDEHKCGDWVTREQLSQSSYLRDSTSTLILKSVFCWVVSFSLLDWTLERYVHEMRLFKGSVILLEPKSYKSHRKWFRPCLLAYIWALSHLYNYSASRPFEPFIYSLSLVAQYPNRAPIRTLPHINSLPIYLRICWDIIYVNGQLQELS